MILLINKEDNNKEVVETNAKFVDESIKTKLE